MDEEGNNAAAGHQGADRQTSLTSDQQSTVSDGFRLFVPEVVAGSPSQRRRRSVAVSSDVDGMLLTVGSVRPTQMEGGAS